MEVDNEFEKERLLRIARNNEVLAGLAVQQLKPPAAATDRTFRGEKEGTKWRSRSGSVAHRQNDPGPKAPVRSSPRIAALHAGGLRPSVDTLPNERVEARGSTKRKKGATAASEELTDAPPKASASVGESLASDGTIRATAVVSAVELAGWIGEEVLSGRNPPKASAVSLLTRGTPDGDPPRFSKYSGVAEMADAVAVFVNLDKGAGEVYDNAFSHGGRRMSWFASSRMHEETPAIQRMLRTLPAATSSPQPGVQAVPAAAQEDQGPLADQPPGAAERVLLFLREPGCYYTFCGEIRAVGWAPGSRPLQLTWELVHFDLLTRKPAFQDLLGEVLQPSK